MKKKKIYITDLHFEHTTWMKELNFQRDELSFFKRRLEEVIPRYTSKEVLSKSEQLQNQLIMHDEVLDTLIHDINSHEHQLSSYAQEHPIAIDHVHFDDHSGLRGKLDDQRLIYADFKQHFLDFLRETM